MVWVGLCDNVLYNVYGGREIKEGKYSTVIGIFGENKRNGIPHKINGGEQRRMFTHIDDIISGLVLVGEKGSGEYCIGNPKEYSILEVAKMFGGEIEILPCKKGDRNFSKIDLTRIKKLGWKAIIKGKDLVKKMESKIQIPLISINEINY